MKTKTYKKKLTLNKKTIANLGNGQLGVIKGGLDLSVDICRVSLNSGCLECTGTCQACETVDTCETCRTCNTCGTCETCITCFSCKVVCTGTMCTCD